MPKVMVVDDEPDLVRLVEFILQKEGFDVIACSDGRTALNLVEDEKPDLIILDIMMPLLDGMEVLRQIRSRRGTARVPVIMLTAKTASVTVDEARQLWVSDYVMKPFDPEKLVLKVKKALKMPT
ncbi:MAG: response regulator [Armatimonadetes bacterium]|nr:response regulator [Armatimonadota bacterium]